MRQRLGWEHCQFVTWHTLMTEVCPGVVGHLKNVENSLDGQTQCKAKEGQHGLISHSAILHSNRSNGPSGVAPELILATGKLVIQWMTYLYNDILDEGLIPSD